MRIRQRRRPRRGGAAAVEMAIVLPLFLALTMGTIEASRLGMVSQQLQTTAREACRVAVQPNQSLATVRARVTAALAGSGITPTVQVSSSAGDWTTAPPPASITVRLTVPFRQVSWLEDPFLLGDRTIVVTATMCSEKG